MKSVRRGSGQFFRHTIEIVDNRVKSVHAAQTVNRLDSHRKVSFHDFFRGSDDSSDRAIHHDFPAHRVKERKQQAQQQHVEKSENGGLPNDNFGQLHIRGA